MSSDPTTEGDAEFEWVPAHVDIDRPNAARMYDYYLGGGHNFAADRELAQKVLRQCPQLPELARRVRTWLRIAVSTLAGECGIDQFLDLGSGIPTAGNVHEIARRVNPDCRLVYVDNEWVAAATADYLIKDLDGVQAIQADFTKPRQVLEHPVVQKTLDFSRPIAVIFSMTLHLITDEQNPAAVVAAYRDATVPGSYLAISHGTADNRPDIDKITALYRSATNAFVPRGRSEVEALFDGYQLIPPGLVFTAQWRPEGPVDDEQARLSACYAGVGRKIDPDTAETG